MIQQTITLNSSWGTNLSIGENWNNNYPLGAGTGFPGKNWYDPNLYQPIVEKYYPVYAGYWGAEPNKTEKAFKILQKLIETKRVQIDKVKDFIEAINEIVEVL